MIDLETSGIDNSEDRIKKEEEGDDNSKDPEKWTDSKKERVSKGLIRLFQDDRYVAHKQETYRKYKKKGERENPKRSKKKEDKKAGK